MVAKEPSLANEWNGAQTRRVPHVRHGNGNEINLGLKVAITLTLTKTTPLVHNHTPIHRRTYSAHDYDSTRIRPHPTSTSLRRRANWASIMRIHLPLHPHHFAADSPAAGGPFARIGGELVVIELQGELTWEGEKSNGVVGVLGLDRPVSCDCWDWRL